MLRPKSSMPARLILLAAVFQVLFGLPVGSLDTTHATEARVASGQGQPTAPPQSQIDERVWEALKTTGAARVLIALVDTEAPGADTAQRASRIAQTQASVLARLSSQDFKLTRRYTSVFGMAGIVTQQGIRALRAHPFVASIQLDEQGYVQLAESVPALRADIVHATYNLTGQGVVVAVVDTGVDTDHPDLSDDIVGQHCFTDGDCPPSNTNEGTSAEDEHGHGTNVTGVITSKGIVSSIGFAPDADIVAVRVFSATGGTFVSDWVAGLDWIYANLDTSNVKIVNMSIATTTRYPGNCDSNQALLASAISQLSASGVAIFAAAGNHGEIDSLSAPACNTDVIAVGATYDSDLGREPDSGTYQSQINFLWPPCFDDPTFLHKIACFTNSNALLDILAPGARITSSTLGGITSTLSGTSQSSPTAAGIAALMLQANNRLTPAGIENLLKTTGIVVTDTRNGLQFPAIDALDAIVAASSQPISVTLDGPASGLVDTAYTFTATVSPITATTPLTYTWQATGQTPVTQTLDGPTHTLTLTWTAPGLVVITATVSGAGSVVSATHSLAVQVPVAAVALSGPGEALIESGYTFTATVSPITATTPLTYTWEARYQALVTQTLDGPTHTLTLTWTTPGLVVITATVSGAGSPVSTTHSFAVKVPPAAVELSGTGEALVNSGYTFTTTVSPITATTPLTYTWEATDQAPVTQTLDSPTHTLALTWTMPGLAVITATVSGPGGLVSHTHVVTIEYHRLRLPIISNELTSEVARWATRRLGRATKNKSASAARFRKRDKTATYIAARLPTIGSSASAMPASRTPRPPGTNTAANPASQASANPDRIWRC